MPQTIAFLVLLGLGAGGAPPEIADAADERLERLVAARLGAVEAGDGFWRGTFRGEPVFVFYHREHDRMRVMTPVAAADDLDARRLRRLLEANYRGALDARYAVDGNVLWSLFVHPLAALADEEFASAVEQVVELKKTYGTSYTSTGLAFGDPPQR